MPGAIEHALRTQRAMSLRREPVKLRKWPRPRFPTKERLLYYRQLVAMVEQVQALVVREVLPKLAGIMEAHALTRPIVPERTDTGDDKHPRVPKGSSHGGEFTSKGGVAGGKGVKAQLSPEEHALKAQKVEKKAAAAAKKARIAAAEKKAIEANVAKFTAGQAAGVDAKATKVRAEAAAQSLNNPADHTGTGPLHVPTPAGMRESIASGAREHIASIEPVPATLRAVLPAADAAAANTWTDKWVHHSSDHEADKMMAGLVEPHSWQQAQHAATQAVLQHHMPELQQKGVIDEHGYVTLYRGVHSAQATAMHAHFDAGNTQHALPTRHISSWSETNDGGRAFAQRGPDGIILQTRVHHTRLVATAVGQGAAWQGMEREWSVISERGHIPVTKSADQRHARAEPVRTDTNQPRRAKRTDAADTDIDDLFDAVGEAAQAAIPEHTIGLVAQQNALRVTVWNGNELNKQVQQVAKINLFDNTTGLAEHLELFVADNVKLVKSLVFGQLDDLKGIVIRGARAGMHHTVVAEQIRERFGVTKKRAALIATDQIGKLNGELNQLRQTNLGVRRYRWSSSQDERVRPMHRKLNGTIQTWKDPPVVDQRTGERGHPGQPIRCRCQPIPIIDDVLADAGLMDPEDVELQHPAAGNAQPPTKPWVPPKLPPLPRGVPQPPPANMAEAAAQAVRNASEEHAAAATSTRTPANSNVPPAMPPTPPGGGGPPRGRGKPPGEPPSGAPGAGPLPDAPRPTKALVRRAAKLVTHDADYYDRGLDIRRATPAEIQVFEAGPCMQLIDSAGSRDGYAQWMNRWVGASTARLAFDARRGIAVEGSALRDGYLATQAFLESRLGRLRSEGIVDQNGYVTLFRGIYDDNARDVRAQHAAGGAVSCRVREAASWTDSLRSGRAVAMGGEDGVVLRQKIHYTRVFSTYRANGYHWARSPDAEWTVLHDDGIVGVDIMELL